MPTFDAVRGCPFPPLERNQVSRLERDETGRAHALGGGWDTEQAMATTTIENHRRCAAATLPRCQGVFIYWLAFGEWVWTPIALVGGPKRIIDHTGDKMYAIGDRFLMSPDDGRTWKPMSFPTSIPGYGPGGIQVSISGTGSRIP